MIKRTREVRRTWRVARLFAVALAAILAIAAPFLAGTGIRVALGAAAVVCGLLSLFFHRGLREVDQLERDIWAGKLD